MHCPHGKENRIIVPGTTETPFSKKLLGRNRAEQEKVQRRSFAAALAGFGVVMLRDGAAYAFLIAGAAAGEVDAAQFVLYFTAITRMAEFMSGILGWWSEICEGALQISDFREDLEIAGGLNQGKGIPLPEGAFSIEFRNVSFQYPEGEKKILNRISFRIEADSPKI